MIRQLLLSCSLLLCAAATLPAQDTVHTEYVEFARNVPQASYSGSVRGHAATTYVVTGRAGETLNIRLVASSPFNYFSVYAPQADTAMYYGPATENGFSRPLTMSGDYEIRVFLDSDHPPGTAGTYSIMIRLMKPGGLRAADPR
jgi:hypothetical protein